MSWMQWCRRASTCVCVCVCLSVCVWLWSMWCGHPVCSGLVCLATRSRSLIHRSLRPIPARFCRARPSPVRLAWRPGLACRKRLTTDLFPSPSQTHPSTLSSANELCFDSRGILSCRMRFCVHNCTPLSSVITSRYKWNPLNTFIILYPGTQWRRKKGEGMGNFPIFQTKHKHTFKLH